MLEKGEDEKVADIGKKAAGFVVGTGALIAAGPTIQGAIVAAELGPVSTAAAAAASGGWARGCVRVCVGWYPMACPMASTARVALRWGRVSSGRTYSANVAGSATNMSRRNGCSWASFARGTRGARGQATGPSPW